MAAEWIALIDEAARKGCRRVTVLNPTRALVNAYGLSFADLQELCGKATGIDYGVLDERQDRIRALLERTKAVHITSELGTDLRLRIENRPIQTDCGCIPRGEVYVAPHEDSANGVAVIDKAFVTG